MSTKSRQTQRPARELRQGEAYYRCCIPALAGFASSQSIAPDGSSLFGQISQKSKGLTLNFAKTNEVTDWFQQEPLSRDLLVSLVQAITLCPKQCRNRSRQGRVRPFLPTREIALSLDQGVTPDLEEGRLQILFSPLQASRSEQDAPWKKYAGANVNDGRAFWKHDAFPDAVDCDASHGSG